MEIKYYINRYGIKILKCCASCKHKDLHAGNRICLLTRCKANSKHCCSQWDVAPQLENAGKGSGKVKKKDYLQYVMEHRDRNTLLPYNADIAEQYEQEYGSIYLSK